MADLIVIGGAAAVEKAAKNAGVEVTVPFVPGRMDTTEELTDGESFEWLKPVADGFRDYHNDEVDISVPDEHLFLDKAHLLTLTAPEWTALAGGLKVLDVNYDGSGQGLFTDVTPGCADAQASATCMGVDSSDWSTSASADDWRGVKSPSGKKST